MNQDIRHIESVDDEINLWELMNQIKDGWQWVVGGGVAALAGAIGFVLLAPAQYEATAVVQPATVGALTTTTTTTTTPIEPVAQTLERLKLVTFYSDDIVKACDAVSAKDLANNVKVNLIKGNNLLSISYRAESSVLANACISKIVTQLTHSQAAIAAPLIKELQSQQVSTKQQIDDVERFLAAGEKRATSSPVSGELSTLMLLKRGDLTTLQKLYREQRVQLTEPLTQPIKLLEPIYAPEKPVSPKRLMVVAISLIGGLFIGLLALFVNRSWRGYKGR